MRTSGVATILLIGLTLASAGAGSASAQEVKKASQIYFLVASVAPNTTESLQGPDGPFSVPKGKVFLIKSIHVFPISPAPGVVNLLLKVGNSTPDGWNLPLDRPTHIPYGVGRPIGPGPTGTLAIESPPASDGTVTVQVNGYLAKDR